MHLFAGVGGGLLADLILGHKPIVAVEWDKYACRVLRERVADGWFPGMSVWEGDVRLFDPSEYAGRVDCIHAGFPCQDISVAGKQAGLGEGTRSGLYREILRIAGVVRPRYLFLENVSAILSNGLGTVLGDLAAMGYDARWLCIRASDVGAPHQRDRWFALAYTVNGSNYANRNKAGETDSLQSLSREAGYPWMPVRTGGNTKVLADRPQGQRQDGDSEGQAGLCDRARGDEEQGVFWYTDSRRRNERAQRQIQGGENTKPTRSGSITWWETESLVGRVADGIPNRVGMLKGLGNAQVPLQAAAAWRLLISRIHD